MKLENIEMQSFTLSFLNQDSYSISFDFSKTPAITACSDSDVNLFVESVTKSGCIVRSSAPITDTVYVSVIGYNT